MKSVCVVAAFLVLATTSTSAADLSPSAAMRQLPMIPAAPTVESCTAAPLLAQAEQQAMSEMMQAQQLAMQGMSAGGSAISNKQGALIARLMDPAITMCEMSISMTAANVDLSSELIAGQSAIRQRARREMESKCPVLGKADYREPACVEPFEKRSHEEERALIARFIRDANVQLGKEVDAYASCLETREKLAAEATAAKLPVQYLSMAQSGRASGWQMVGTLAERFETLCSSAASASEDLAMRENAR